MVSGLALLLALVAVSLIQYYLANKPIAVNVNAQKTSPAIARVNQEEIVIENPVDDANSVLFLIDGQVNEIVDMHFEKARLSQPSLERFEHLPKPAPAGPETIDFIAQDVSRVLKEQDAKAGRGGDLLAKRGIGLVEVSEKGQCRTFVKVEVAKGAKFPMSQRFHQSSNSDPIRDFYVT